MVCRVFLAIFEAAYGPGVPLYLSFFYPREKLGLRTGIFLSGSAAANAYGGALAYGISQARGSIGPWRILFIVEGIPTCILAVVAWFFLPDDPHSARFLSEREREIAIDLSLRQPGDRTGNKGIQWKQVIGGLKDYRCEHSNQYFLFSRLLICLYQHIYRLSCTSAAMFALHHFHCSYRPSYLRWAPSPQFNPMDSRPRHTSSALSRSSA